MSGDTPRQLSMVAPTQGPQNPTSLKAELVRLEQEAEVAQEKCRLASVKRRDIMREIETEKQAALRKDKDRRVVMAKLLNEINSADAIYRAKLVEIEQTKQGLRQAAVREIQ